MTRKIENREQLLERFDEIRCACNGGERPLRVAAALSFDLFGAATEGVKLGETANLWVFRGIDEALDKLDPQDLGVLVSTGLCRYLSRMGPPCPGWLRFVRRTRKFVIESEGEMKAYTVMVGLPD